MCKLDKSFNTGIKSYSFLHWKCLAKDQPCRRGSAPYRRSDWTSRLWGCPNRTVEKTRRVRVLALSSSCNSLALLNSARSNARKADLEAGPPDSLSTKPTIGGGLRPCQSRNGATKSTIAEESFPDDVTQPSQVSTREQPKEPELNTWRPKQRTELTRENEPTPSLL